MLVKLNWPNFYCRSRKWIEFLFYSIFIRKSKDDNTTFYCFIDILLGLGSRCCISCSRCLRNLFSVQRWLPSHRSSRHRKAMLLRTQHIAYDRLAKLHICSYTDRRLPDGNGSDGDGHRAARRRRSACSSRICHLILWILLDQVFLDQIRRVIATSMNAIVSQNTSNALAQKAEYLRLENEVLKQKTRFERALIGVIISGYQFNTNCIIVTESLGVIKYFSSGAQQLLGYSPAELIGRYTPTMVRTTCTTFVVGFTVSTKTVGFCCNCETHYKSWVSSYW